MALQFHPYSLILAISALISAVAGIAAWTRRPAPGAAPLAVLMLSLTVWSCTYAVMWLNTSEGGQVFWLNVTYFGVLVIPAGFLIFVLHATQHENWLTPARLGLLSIEPLATLAVVWSNDFHRLFHSSYSLEIVNGFAALNWTRGPWFWLNVVYSYSLLLIGCILLVRALMLSAPLFRAQISVLLLGASLPWIANIYSQLEFNTLRDLDLTPVAFSLTGLLFAYSLFRQRMFDLLPVARSLIIERMSEGVMVVDEKLRILDVNPAARQMLQIDSRALGRPGTEVFPEWTDIAQVLQGGRQDFRAEVQGRRDPSRRIDLSIGPLLDRRGRLSGYLIVFRDITERWQAEQDVRQANRQLKERLKEINVLQKKLRGQAIRDPLTNLYNRRHLREVLERELVRAERDGSRVSIILIDIDDFKKINDTYGHKAGDRALQYLADLFHTHIRGSDIACRYGGEEFVIVMPGSLPQIARRRVEHVRHEFLGEDLYGRHTAGQTTLSIGVATYPEHGRHADELLHAADEAMYTAKSRGGNRTVIYKPSSGGKKTARKTAGSKPSSKPGRTPPRKPKATR
jgi:diguanylate cyclase (GGDEF)-like protein/PAS domain S-box-containing protein